MQKKKNENRNRRLRLEKEMRDGFTRAHTALREIHKDKLYEPEYRSFAEYALAVWGYSKGYAHRLLNYADFLEESPNGDLKSHLSEGAYRPLERLHDPAQKKQAVEKLTEFIKIGAAITEQVTDQIAREIMPPSVAGPRAIEVDVEMFAVQAGYLSAKVKETLGKIDAAAAAGNALNGLNGVLELAHTVGGLILEIVDTKDEEKAKRLLAAYLTDVASRQRNPPPQETLPEPELAPATAASGGDGPGANVAESGQQNPPPEVIPPKRGPDPAPSASEKGSARAGDSGTTVPVATISIPANESATKPEIHHAGDSTLPVETTAESGAREQDGLSPVAPAVDEPGDDNQQSASSGPEAAKDDDGLLGPAAGRGEDGGVVDPELELGTESGPSTPVAHPVNSNQSNPTHGVGSEPTSAPSEREPAPKSAQSKPKTEEELPAVKGIGTEVQIRFRDRDQYFDFRGTGLPDLRGELYNYKQKRGLWIRIVDAACVEAEAARIRELLDQAGRKMKGGV